MINFDCKPQQYGSASSDGYGNSVQMDMVPLVMIALILLEGLDQHLNTSVRKHLKPNAIQLHVLSLQSIARTQKRKFVKSSLKEYLFQEKSKFVMTKRKRFVN